MPLTRAARHVPRLIARMLARVLALLAATPGVSAAHPGAPLAPHDLWSAWRWEPGVLATVALGAAWYALGVRRLWRRAGRGRGVSAWRAAAFAGGLAAVLVALVSPLDALGGALFSAHMAQHLVLIVVAAPLVVLGAPLLPGIWALPDATRRRWARAWVRAPRLRATAATLTAPSVAWLLHVGALWLWHFPAVYDRALRDDAVHALEHASFLGTALLFWWVVLQPVGRRRIGRAGGMLYVFAAAMQGAALGALLTFARRPWYLAHGTAARGWGLSPLEDQQLAGLIMWVPGGLAYLIAIGAAFVGWLRAEAGDHAEDARRLHVREGTRHAPASALDAR